MIQSITRRRRRQADPRVVLVNIDGTPVRRLEPSALVWSPSCDNWRWTVADEPPPAAATLPGLAPEPESDEQFFGRLAAEETMERDRVLATYQPLPEDLIEYRAWAEALDAGTLPPAAAERFRFSSAEDHALRTGQVSSDELAVLAAGMPI
jgi:hypothetical protein